MRISITDRCNLRCKYCMPDGVESLARWEILSLEEIEAIAICAAGLGISRIKVTGGEPLVRRDCCQLVKLLKSIHGIEKVTITTNGVLLDQLAAVPAHQGLPARHLNPADAKGSGADCNGLNLLQGQDFRTCQAFHTVWHAVPAPQVAPVRDGYPHIVNISSK